MLRMRDGFVSFFVVLPLVLIVGFGVLMTGLSIKAYNCEKKTGRKHAALDEALKDCR